MLVMTSPHCYSDADEDMLGDDQTPLRDTPVSFSENYAFCLNADSPTISKDQDATTTTDVSIEASKNTANEAPSCSKLITSEPSRRVLRNEFSQPLSEARSNRTCFHPGEVNQTPVSGALYRATFASGHSLSTIESGHTFEASESGHAPFRPSHSILTNRFSQPPTSAIIEPPHSILMTREWNRSVVVGDSAHPLLSSRPSRTVILADPTELSRDVSSQSGGNHASVVFTNTPVKAPRMKSLIDRQLRKFASETSFATTAETASDSSEQDLAAGRGRVFTVRPVSNSSCNRINTGGTVFGRLIRKRQESDGSGSLGSEATVASGSVTPLSRHKMRSRMRRPKSATHMGHGSEFGNHGSSGASATIHSMHSLDSMQLLTLPKDERRPSNIYTMDDDSVHEFEEDNGWLIIIDISFLFFFLSPAEVSN